MSNIYVNNLAAATAALNYNVIGTEEKRVQDYNRVIVSYGMVGSAAIGDTVAELRVGGRVVATLINTATGLGLTSDHMLADRIFVPANTEVQLVITDAAATNAIAVRIVFVP